MGRFVSFNSFLPIFPPVVLFHPRDLIPNGDLVLILDRW